MKQIPVMIDQRIYKIACADGEEERLQKIVDYFNQHLKEIKSALGGSAPIQDQLLYLLTSFTIIDDLWENHAKKPETNAKDSNATETQAKTTIEAPSAIDKEFIGEMDHFIQETEKTQKSFEAKIAS